MRVKVKVVGPFVTFQGTLYQSEVGEGIMKLNGRGERG